MKTKKVLIALDYDPSTKKIAETGYSFAKAMGAEIILLHVIADTTYYSALEYSPIVGMVDFSFGDLTNTSNPDGLKKETIHFLEKIKKHLGDETIQTIVREGDFAESILKAAKEVHADAIVIGSHSQKWFENILMGSVTEKVLRNTILPLFIVPTKKQK